MVTESTVHACWLTHVLPTSLRLHLGLDEWPGPAGWVERLATAVVDAGAARLDIVAPVSRAVLDRAGVSSADRPAGGDGPLGPFEQDGLRFWALPYDDPLDGLPAVLHRWTRPGMPDAVADDASVLVERLEPDLVHVHGTEGPLGLIACRSHRPPVVVSLQGIVTTWRTVVLAGMRSSDRLRLLFDPRTVKGWGVLHDRRALRSAAVREQRIMRSDAVFLGRTGWDREVLHTIAPSARYQHCDEILAAPFYQERGRCLSSEGLRSSSGPATVFTTSSDLPGKGTECLLHAVAMLASQRPVQLRVAGISAGSQLDAFYRRQARAAGVERAVSWLGRLDAVALAKELAAADVFAYPSHGDNSPNSLCEAMLVGVPCVATEVGGIPSLLEDGKEGLLVPDGDASALAAALRRLLDDPPAARRLAAAARLHAQRRHDPATVVRQLTVAYGVAVGGRRPSLRSTQSAEREVSPVTARRRVGPDTQGSPAAISIVTPSLNQAGFLEQTLRSVLEQQYPALEYVVVDAGSVDGSADIVARHGAGLAWWVSEVDAGHADGINKGFAHTHGEIMSWINSSDVQFPWTLQTVAAVFRDLPQVQWITGLPAHLNEDGELVEVWKPRSWGRYDILSGRVTLQQEGVFWRRRLWEAAGGALDLEAGVVCDYELWSRFARLAQPYFVPVPLGGFRFHAQRRGDDSADPYRVRMAEVAAAARARLPMADRRKCTVAAALDGPVGYPLRRVMAAVWRTGFLGLPRVRYDLERRRWVVA